METDFEHGYDDEPMGSWEFFAFYHCCYGNGGSVYLVLAYS